MDRDTLIYLGRVAIWTPLAAVLLAHVWTWRRLLRTP